MRIQMKQLRTYQHGSWEIDKNIPYWVMCKIEAVDPRAEKIEREAKSFVEVIYNMALTNLALGMITGSLNKSGLLK